jgi:hypothetical protein
MREWMLDPGFLHSGTSCSCLPCRSGDILPGIHFIGGYVIPRVSLEGLEHRTFFILPGLDDWTLVGHTNTCTLNLEPPEIKLSF